LWVKTGFGYLLVKTTSFRIRIQRIISSDGRQSLKVGVVLQIYNLDKPKFCVINDAYGYWVYIAALRLDDGSLLVVTTHKQHPSTITLKDGVETVFGILKLVGLFGISLKDSERLGKLLALLSLACVGSS